MAGESPVAFAANVAADAGVDLHVLLQSGLGLETLPTKEAEDGHVRPCTATKNTTRCKHLIPELVNAEWLRHRVTLR